MNRTPVRPGWLWPGQLVFSGTVLTMLVPLLVLLPVARPSAMLVAGLGLAYLSMGLLVFPQCLHWTPLACCIRYFVPQLLCGALLLVLSQFMGPSWIVLLPLVGQSIEVLPRSWSLLIIVLVNATFDSALALVGGTTLLWNSLPFVASTVFIALFMQVVMRERQARAEAERLTTALQNAHAQLRSYALLVEDLATATERDRLAREVHDSLGYYLTSIAVQLGAAQTLFPSDPPPTHRSGSASRNA